MSDFAKHSPGAEEAGLLALELFNDLLGILRHKGILNSNEVVFLLETTAHRLAKSPNELAKHGSRFINTVMLPHQHVD